MLYSVSCQYAHHEHHESTQLGVMAAADVLRCFDEFNWEDQVLEANRLGKVSPTLSVEDKTNDRLIWVSGYGERDITFVSECRFTGLTRRLFGLLGPGTVTLHTQRFNGKEARRALELFMSDQQLELRRLYEAN